MHDGHGGPRRAGGAGRPAGRAGDEGRAAARDRRASRATMREHAVKLSATAGRGVRHLRHGRRRVGHVQHLVGGGVRRRGRAACEWPSTATARCRAAAAAPTCSRRSACNVAAAPAVVERTLREAGIAFFFAPTFHPSMKHAGADAPRARHPHGVQPARSADEPGRRRAPARRRAEARADRAGGASAAAAGFRARLGGARRRRPRRAVHDRAHEGLGVPRRSRPHLLRPPRGLRRAARPRPRELAGGDAAENAEHRARRPRRRKRAGARRGAANAGAALLVAGRVASVREGMRARGGGHRSGAATRDARADGRWSQAGGGA